MYAHVQPLQTGQRSSTAAVLQLHGANLFLFSAVIR